MGYIKRCNGAKRAPEYTCSVIGSPEWSGIEENQFNEKLKSELYSFIVYEAGRQGNNDKVKNRHGENRVFFHDLFLDGWPQRLWEQYYDKEFNIMADFIEKRKTP